MKWPITMTSVFPEFNWIIGVVEKESSELIWNISLHLLEEWKENWLGKMSIIQELEENSLLCGSKAGNISLNLLSISTIESLIISC